MLGRAILENYEYNLVDTPKEIYDKIFQIANTLITNNEDSTIDVKSVWGEQNAYLYGLVIEDSNQNQFVWVPVGTINE